MRSTDPDPVPQRPLGEKVTRPAPAPTQPEWKQKPGAAEGVQEDRNGRLRTNFPLNHKA